MQELLNRLKEFDILLCWSLTRLGRNTRDNLNILYELDKKNVVFITYSDAIDTRTVMGKTYTTILSLVAEMEREHISENIKLIKRQEFENGKITAKKVLGYDLINKQLVMNNKEANIVKFIFETYNKTHNYYQTAKICNNKGYKGKKGQKFHASSIKTIVKNKIYCGFNNFHNEETKKGKHQAIITKSLYDKVNYIA